MDNAFFFAHCILQKMLVYDPANRISAKASMKHPYFDDHQDRIIPMKS